MYGEAPRSGSLRLMSAADQARPDSALGEGLPGTVGDDDPRQPVLGEQPGGVEGVGVDGHDREFLGEFLRAHRANDIAVRSSGCVD